MIKGKQHLHQMYGIKPFRWTWTILKPFIATKDIIDHWLLSSHIKKTQGFCNFVNLELCYLNVLVEESSNKQYFNTM